MFWASCAVPARVFVLEFSYASALAWVMFAILLVLTVAAVAELRTGAWEASRGLGGRIVHRRHSVGLPTTRGTDPGIAWCALFPIIWALSGSGGRRGDGRRCSRSHPQWSTTAGVRVDAVLAG